MNSKRSLALVRVAFWGAALFAFVMAVVPHPPEFPGGASDKIQHIVAFLVLGALGSFAYPRTSPVYLGAGLSLFGAFIELVQVVPSLHRDSDPVDWMADTAAAALMLILLHWLRARLHSRTASKS